MFQRIAVGIDLGTTTTCVALYHSDSGITEFLPTNSGKNNIPSYVAFLEHERRIGEEAKKLSTQIENQPNVVYDIKRLIGRKFIDKEVQEDIKNYKFQVIKDPNSERPQIIINKKNTKEIYTPEEISGFFLKN